jgi:hypothetical protein
MQQDPCECPAWLGATQLRYVDLAVPPDTGQQLCTKGMQAIALRVGTSTKEVQNPHLWHLHGLAPRQPALPHQAGQLALLPICRVHRIGTLAAEAIC